MGALCPGAVRGARVAMGLSAQWTAKLMEILCIGDLHLGRRPAHSSVVVEHLNGPEDISPRAAWQRCVEYALQRRVAAVVLTGDLVEDPSDFYEAYADLKRGVQQLHEQGIAVVAVAGNHDYKILPALAQSIEGLELLGAGGHWSSTLITGSDAALELVGWSFSSERSASPLHHPNDLPEPSHPGAARVGVLHCDRDGSSGAYAPVRSATLNRAAVDGWLLGHIHKPDDLAGGAPNGYLGSVVGLDPTEEGPHGPWLLQLTGDGSMTMEQVVLAPLRWERLAVDVTDLPEPDALRGRLVEALGDLDARIQEGAVTRARAVGVRIRFTGETADRAGLLDVLQRDELERHPVPVSDTLYFVDAWVMETRPVVDLEQRAQGDDPVAVLARRLLVLDEPDSEDCQALVARTQKALHEFKLDRRFSQLDRDPPSAEATRQYLKEAGLQALDRFIEQEEHSP